MNDDINCKPDRPLVQVQWADSQSVGPWHHENDLNDEYELPLVYTNGYLIQETDDYVTIAGSVIFYENVSNQICGLMTIPRGCIRDIRKLRLGATYVRSSN